MMRDVSTEGLALLARGGQAEIYDCGGGKVLRVAKRPQDFDAIRNEYDVYSFLAQTSLPVPRRRASSRSFEIRLFHVAKAKRLGAFSLSGKLL